MEALGYYKWHWQAWRANRRVQRMSWQARGLYRELLDEFWKEGVLSSDRAYLAEEVCGCSIEEFETYWPEIAPCWHEVEGGLANAKMEDQRTEKDRVRLANARAGSSGAKAKLARAEQTPSERQQVSSGCQANASECQALAEHLPDTFQQQSSERHIEREKREREESAPSVRLTLPDFIPSETWEDFRKMRKQIKKPLTNQAEKIIFAKLQRCYDAGGDALACLQNSLVNCWQDVYTDKAPKRPIEFRPATADDDLWADIGAKSA